MPRNTTHTQPEPAGEELRDQAAGAMLGANPFIGLSGRHLAAAAGRLLLHAARHAPTTADEGRRLLGRLARVAKGTASCAPEAGDRRFADEVWSSNPIYRRVMQGYLACREFADRLVDRVGLDRKSAQRARFAVSLVTEALAPTNTLLGNPAALTRAAQTRGRSLADGVRHLGNDLLHNGGMPSMVDTEPFILGETVAVSPGRVVYRNDVLEVIHYKPATTAVHERPLLIVPPQINKFWVLDLAPGRSMVEYLVGQGQQVFMVSWRNPTAEQRHWRLDTYVEALKSALDVACEVGKSADVNLVGACAGGITSAVLLGHLAAHGDRRVRSVTLLVTVLDMTAESAITLFLSEPAVGAAIRRSRKKGVVDGREMARVFAWLRPNDLVWSYWVNNYLLGNKPPAFDVLAWNADSTNLPAGLHADFLTIALDDALSGSGRVEVLGTPIELGKVDCDAYFVGARTDHITPWEACYRSAHLLGGDTQFVLSSSGHIQALVNPPGNARSRYFTNPELPPDAESWLTTATTEPGTWWEHWAGWLAERAGERVPATRALGSSAHPPGDVAPGVYVRG